MCMRSPNGGRSTAAGPGRPATGTGATGTATASPGGLLEGSRSSEALDALLQADAGSYTWAAAAVGSNSASGYQLSADVPVMAIGGFNGSDPSPTLAQFQQYVQDGKIHYFLAGGGGMGGGGMGPGGMGSSSTNAISTWVTSTFTSTTVDGVTVYDLTAS